MTDLIMTVLAQNRPIKSVKLIRGFLENFGMVFGKLCNFWTNNRTNFIKRDANIILFKNYSSLHRLAGQLAAGVLAHEVKVDLKISVLKPKRAEWIVQIFDRFHSNRGQEIIKAGFRRSGITEALDKITFPTCRTRSRQLLLKILC